LRVFRVEVEGEVYTVSVEDERKNRIVAHLDGVAFEAEPTSKGDTTTWLIQNPSGRIHAHAKPLPNDRVDVWLACMPFSTKVQSVGIGGYSIPSDVQKRGFGGQIHALMPGRITSVLVREGERVREGAPLLILEAMKMQNEITSMIDGKVAAIYVHEGDTVKKGSVLISLE